MPGSGVIGTACFAANRDTAALWDDLRDLDETVRSGRSGAVQVQPVGGTTGAVVEPAGMLAFADYARSLGATVVLQTDLPDMRVEPSA